MWLASQPGVKPSSTSSCLDTHASQSGSNTHNHQPWMPPGTVGQAAELRMLPLGGSRPQLASAAGYSCHHQAGRQAAMLTERSHRGWDAARHRWGHPAAPWRTPVPGSNPTGSPPVGQRWVERLLQHRWGRPAPWRPPLPGSNPTGCLPVGQRWVKRLIQDPPRLVVEQHHLAVALLACGQGGVGGWVGGWVGGGGGTVGGWVGRWGRGVVVGGWGHQLGCAAQPAVSGSRAAGLRRQGGGVGWGGGWGRGGWGDGESPSGMRRSSSIPRQQRCWSAGRRGGGVRGVWGGGGWAGRCCKMGWKGGGLASAEPPPTPPPAPHPRPPPQQPQRPNNQARGGGAGHPTPPAATPQHLRGCRPAAAVGPGARGG